MMNSMIDGFYFVYIFIISVLKESQMWSLIYPSWNGKENKEMKNSSLEILIYFAQVVLLEYAGNGRRTI